MSCYGETLITNNKRVNIMEVFVSVMMFLEIFRNYNETTLMLKYPLIVLGIGLLFYCVFYYRINLKIILFSIIFIILIFINGMINDSNSYFNAIVSITVFLPIAIFLLYKEKLNVVFWYWFFVFIIALLFVVMYSSVDGYLLFFETSRNYVSIYTIVIMFFCITAAEKNQTQVPIILVVLSFLLATYSIGRGGIISTFFLLTAICIYRAAKSSKIKNALMVISAIVFMIIVLMIVIINWDHIINRIFPRLGGEDTMGSNTERMQILRTYIDGIINAPIDQLLFGLRPDKLAGPFGRVKWNIHNSFLQSFADFGLIGVICLGYLLLRTTIFLIKRRMIEPLIIMLTFLIRAFTDYVFPCSIGDILIYFYCFFPWVSKQKRNTTRWIQKNNNATVTED